MTYPATVPGTRSQGEQFSLSTSTTMGLHFKNHTSFTFYKHKIIRWFDVLMVAQQLKNRTQNLADLTVSSTTGFYSLALFFYSPRSSQLSKAEQSIAQILLHVRMQDERPQRLRRLCLKF